MSHKAIPSTTNSFHADHVRLLADSFRKLLGRPLIELSGDKKDFGREIFFADFALVSHNFDPDPMFNYANRTALNLFEFAWDEFIGLPSRFSAEPVNREERAALLAQVSAKGYIENYSGIRITKSGKRFRINNAAIWNVFDADNVYCGQAACFKDWVFLKE